MKIRNNICFLFVLINSITISQNLDTLLIENDRLKIGFINNGNIGNVKDGEGFFGVRYDGIHTLYSAGIYLSGKNQGTIWTNGAFATDRIGDYLPGKFNNPSSILDKFYSVRSSDPDFGVTWQEWIGAVEQGAAFYDGNNDSIYSPVDLNENGEWDSNEDRPDLIGDFTAWNIFNDGVAGSERKMTEMKPLGIEVKQTVFGTSSDDIEELKDVIFVKYEIKNTGEVTDYLDSVYLGLAYDFDLGDYEDDLSGCNIDKNIGYFYNDSSDYHLYFGDTPPAAFIDLLEGPAVFIPNVTYLDNNENGVYDNQIDTALDSALVKHGSNLGVEVLKGAMNLGMTSFTVYLSSLTQIGTPDSAEWVRNFLMGGRYWDGDSVIIKEFDIGNGKDLGSAADTIPNHYYFSGDPITGTGWLNTQPWDNRMLVNTGPFELKANEPVNIMFAIIVARGSDYLNSIEKAYEIDNIVQTQYDNNFTDFPVSIINNYKQIPKEIKLLQNYPNPFNPTTTISFSLPKSTNIKLNVYNILGQQVAVLVNGMKTAGNHKVNWDASNMSSGIYLYKLEAGRKVLTNRMILLK